jgi:hypothetical protein
MASFFPPLSSSNLMPPPSSVLPFQPLPVPGAGYTFPAFGQRPVVPDPNSEAMQPTGSMWHSDAPTTGSAALVNADTNKYLEGGDLLFSIRTPAMQRELSLGNLARQRKMTAFNLPALNKWLAENSLKATTMVQSKRVESLSEGQLELALAEGGQLAGATLQEKETLAFACAHSIASRVLFLGPVRNQPNLLTSIDVERHGSISADAGDSQTTWVVQGPANVHNVWGPDAVEGVHLWLQLRRTQRGVFQMLPKTASLSLESQLAPHELYYQGASGISERAVNIYVGQLVSRGRRTAHDALFLKTAINEYQSRPPSASALADARSASQELEHVWVMTKPRKHGLYVVL